MGNRILTTWAASGQYFKSPTDLDLLQNAYSLPIGAIVQGLIGDNYSPPLIYNLFGCVVDETSGNTIISPGFVFFNGEVFSYAGQIFTGTGLTLVANMVTTYTDPIGGSPFQDGSLHNIDQVKTLTLAVGASGTGTFNGGASANNDFANFQVIGREMNFSSISVSTAAGVGGVTGTIYYKKNFINNTLQIKGVLTSNNAQNFAGCPSALYYVNGNLPLGYRPISANGVPFTANYYLSSLIKDDLGISWVHQVNCVINTAGDIGVNWIKPDVAISGYGIQFNCIIPLD